MILEDFGTFSNLRKKKADARALGYQLARIHLLISLLDEIQSSIEIGQKLIRKVRPITLRAHMLLVTGTYAQLEEKVSKSSKKFFSNLLLTLPASECDFRVPRRTALRLGEKKKIQPFRSALERPHGTVLTQSCTLSK